MKIFIDSANFDEIRQALSLGVVAGVTTNPSLVAREGGNFRPLLKQICQVVPGPVSAEVLSESPDEIVKEARDLASLADNIVVKIPLTAAGLEATAELSSQNIKTNLTLGFSATQAMLAARAGATYVSLFVGRLDDVGACGISVVAETARNFHAYALETRIIAASIRNVSHVEGVISAGADYATVPYRVLMDCLKHPLTDQGIEKFKADWEKAIK